MRNIFFVLLLACSSVFSVYDTPTCIFQRQPSDPFEEFHYDVINKSPRVFLLSTRRSGSHWFMYIAQYLTGRIWQTPHKQYIFFPNKIDDKKPLLFRGHETDFKSIYNEKNAFYFPIDMNDDKLIFLIRDYKEVLFTKYEYEKYLNTSLDVFENDFYHSYINSEYLQNLRLYNHWNPEKRLLINYEELITDTESVMKKLAKFLDLPNEDLNSFIKNLDVHKNRSITLMKVFNSNSISYGKDTKFHSKDLPLEFLLIMDNIVQKVDPEIFKEYLFPYVSNPLFFKCIKAK